MRKLNRRILGALLTFLCSLVAIGGMTPAAHATNKPPTGGGAYGSLYYLKYIKTVGCTATIRETSITHGRWTIHQTISCKRMELHLKNQFIVKGKSYENSKGMGARSLTKVASGSCTPGHAYTVAANGVAADSTSKAFWGQAHFTFYCP